MCLRGASKIFKFIRNFYRNPDDTKLLHKYTFADSALRMRSFIAEVINHRGFALIEHLDLNISLRKPRCDKLFF